MYLDDQPLYPTRLAGRLVSRARHEFWAAGGRDADAETDARAYLAAFRRARPDAVLAEFGHVGVQVMDACDRLELPLIVHFHGYDATARPMLARYGDRYPQLFAQAAALVASSRPMREALITLGASPDKTHYVPYGVDLERFVAGEPERAPPVFVAVGRFVDKKAPQLTILAFATVKRRFPEARLRMLGEGELRGACYDLAQGLDLDDAVSLLGEQPHDVVAREMRGARAFVQHSVVAIDGDSEGLPNAILEASATGLPVVSTRHAGIPDIVVDGRTGYLVDEHDVAGMARYMERLLADPTLAAQLGRAGRERIEQSFGIEATIAQLWRVIVAAVNGDGSPGR